ncbi:hypothetical protein OC842_005351, partial [Tilletia horrida]
MDPPDTPTPTRSRPEAGLRGTIDLPDLFSAHRRPGAAGASIDDQGIISLSPTQPRATPMRPGILRPRDLLTPTPAAASKRVRIVSETGTEQDRDTPATADEEELIDPQPAAETTSPANMQGAADKPAGRPPRQAAVEANVSLTRKAQQAALGLGGTRTSPGSLGSSLGIRAANSTEDVAMIAEPQEDSSLHPAGTAREDGADPAAAKGKQQQAKATKKPDAATAAGTDEVGRLIAAIERQQRAKADATTRLIKVVDEVCQAGALSISGAEV